MVRHRLILVLVLNVSIITYAIAQTPVQALFMHDKPMELILETDIDALRQDRSEDPEYIASKLIHKLPENRAHIFDMKVKPRGGTRRFSGICDFPPLKLNFKKNSTVATEFDGQDKLKFVAQCRQNNDFENYLLEEYLVYKTYNILTDESYRVRLVHLTIKDSHDPNYILKMKGFLLEDDEALAVRLGASPHKEKVFSQDSCLQSSMDRFALFQYMIGNTDWYVTTNHNTDIFATSDQSLIPVPFDFDGAGVINTIYAKPSDMTPINSVRERFYKGNCTDPESFRQTVALFLNKKSEIYDLYLSFDALPQRIIRKSLKYYDKFYDELTTPELADIGLFNFCDSKKSFSL